MKDYLNKLLPQSHPLRLTYHKMMAMAAALFYGFPSSDMVVIGVTGTKGKTTTSNIIHKIFSEAGFKTGLLTTVNYKIGDEEHANLTKQSTMSPFQLNKILKEMKRAGCEVLVLEVTSHAMMQSRVWGINFDTAVFTNIAQEHLDYHGTFDEYKRAKGMLFNQLNISPRKSGVQKVSVLNAEDQEFGYFAGFPVDQQFAYGIQKGTYVARDLEMKADSTTFTIKIPNGESRMTLKIPGRMNVYNALAAATVAVAHHINLETIKVAIEGMKTVPGRIEVINEGQPFTVIVDYAHTPDSLEQLLQMFKDVSKKRLITVFGACGDRFKGNRPLMGQVMDKYSDYIVLTDDDPFTEDHKSIASMVREGIKREEGDRFWQILDRREAIRLALSLAEEGDTVVVAGKGAEEFQVVGNKRIPHDDRKVCREILSRDISIDVPHN